MSAAEEALGRLVEQDEPDFQEDLTIVREALLTQEEARLLLAWERLLQMRAVSERVPIERGLVLKLIRIAGDS